MTVIAIFRPVYIDMAPGMCKSREERLLQGRIPRDTTVSSTHSFWTGLHLTQPKGQHFESLHAESLLIFVR
jgi:hypothetical protein